LHNKQKIIAVSIAGLVLLAILIAGIMYISRGIEEGWKYDPNTDLPPDYMILVDKPDTMHEMAFVAALSSLAVHQTMDGAPSYHPMFILQDGMLTEHQLHTIETLANKDVPKLVFAVNGVLPDGLGNQVTIEEQNVFDMDGKRLGDFFTYDGYISVASYREALWVSPLANMENKVIIIDPGTPTFPNQNAVWDEMTKLGKPSDMIVAVNPYDMDVETLETNTPGYFTENFNGNPSYEYQDSLWHIEALGCIAAEFAAYHQAYVITDIQPSMTELGYMNTELNQRAIGQYEIIKNVSDTYGHPEYVVMVGSHAAVPQFQVPDETSSDSGSVEGDKLVSSDVMYGFLTDDLYHMSAATSRLVSLNLPALSNQMVRTWLYDKIALEKTVEYSDGPKTVDWSKHGGSFSGYHITYQRRQATPARYICRDWEDEGMSYEYCGPAGWTGPLGKYWPDPFIQRTDMADMKAVLQASSMVAYRGHGSDYGSLYLLPYMWGEEDGALKSDEILEMYLPPQVAMIVSCMNAKIAGGGWNSAPAPVELERLFCLNYQAAGCIAYAGATEVSFSNVGQDSDAVTGEATGDHKWDLNDAWYAFFWDGLLNHEEEHGTLGKAIQWAENRYINNPNHNKQYSPFHGDPAGFTESLDGPHWKETAMFACYGDPTWSPHNYNMGAGSYDPWHNGNNDQ
jgi:hypothetical protein